MAGASPRLGLFADPADDEDEILDFAGGRIERRFFDALNLNGTVEGD